MNTTKAWEEMKARANELMGRAPNLKFHEAINRVRVVAPHLQREHDEAMKRRDFTETSPRGPMSAKTFSEDLEKRIAEEAQKLFTEHCDKYPTIERARAAAWDLNPELKASAYASQSRARFQGEVPKRFDEQPTDETGVRKEQGQRREAEDAFVDAFRDDVQRRIDRDDVDLEQAVIDTVRAVVLEKFRKAVRAKASKSTSAEGKSFTAEAFADALRSAGVRDITPGAAGSALKRFANAG